MTDRSIQPPRFDADELGALAAAGWSPGARSAPACPDPAIVLAATEGVLDEALAARVRAHVAACPACQRAAADLAGLFDDVSVATRQRLDARLSVVRRPAHRAWFWIPAGAFAAATAVVFAFIVFRPDVMVPAPDSQLARGLGAPTSSVFHPDRPTVVAGDVELAVRGESPVASLATRIGSALDAADAGDAKKAIPVLESTVRAHPQSRDAHLAMGAVLLQDGQSPAALAALERARALPGNPASDDEIDWYLAMALVRTGATDRARTVLGPVCEHKGPRSAVACAGLIELARSRPPR